jgi:hypothetical protein
MNENAFKYKGSLRNLKEQNELVRQLGLEIKYDFPNLESIQLNVELINEICNKIENKVKTRGLKNVNKLDFFYLIYTEVFNDMTLTKNKLFINSIIDYLHANNLISSVSMLSKLAKVVCQVFLTKGIK